VIGTSGDRVIGKPVETKNLPRRHNAAEPQPKPKTFETRRKGGSGGKEGGTPKPLTTHSLRLSAGSGHKGEHEGTAKKIFAGKQDFHD
jgi:hypothetical protein